MNVTELGERPVMRPISARETPGFCRIALSTKRSLAWRSADFFRAPPVVNVTAGMKLVDLFSISFQYLKPGSGFRNPRVLHAAYNRPSPHHDRPISFAICERFRN